jgi:hypothetical protein
MDTKKCAYPDCNNTYGIILVSHICTNRVYDGKCVFCVFIYLCGDHNKNSNIINICSSLETYERKNLNELCKCIITDKLNQFVVEGFCEHRTEWYMIHMKDGNYIFTLKYSSGLSFIYTSHIIPQLYISCYYNKFQQILDKYEQYTYQVATASMRSIGLSHELTANTFLLCKNEPFEPVLDSLKVNAYTYLHQLPKDITNIIRMYL